MKKTEIALATDLYDMSSMLDDVDETADIKTDLAIQLESYRKTAAEYPEFYALENMMASPDGDAYRTGKIEVKRDMTSEEDECDMKSKEKQPYMTLEDYKRLVLERTRLSQYNLEGTKGAKVYERPATVYTVRQYGKALANTKDSSSAFESVMSDNGYEVVRVESSNTNLKDTIACYIKAWFPNHISVKQSRESRRNALSPLGGIAWVMIFALVLVLPIALSVIKSQAATELNQKSIQLAELEKVEAELRAEFDSSLDLREIERIATEEIGMIKLNDSTIRVLRLNDFDSIESFTDKKSNSVVPALLSALGIRPAEE